MAQHTQFRQTQRPSNPGIATGTDTIDVQWREYYRHLFGICAARLPASDTLSSLAVAVATPAELARMAGRVLERAEALKLPQDTIDELRSTQSATAGVEPQHHDCAEDPVSVEQLRPKWLRMVRMHESIQRAVVDFVAGGLPAGGRQATLPAIAGELATVYDLSPLHTRILVALYATADFEPVADVVSAAGHRLQFTIVADAAEVGVTEFVTETAPGARLERLGLIGYLGGRDEVADIEVARPLVFALRSNTLGDLQAGLFDETPPPIFDVSAFAVSADEVRNCGAAVCGSHPLLIAGDPGTGKTEFARALVAACGRQAHSLAATCHRSEHPRVSRGEAAQKNRFNAIRMAANLLSPTDDVLIIDEADAILQSATDFFGLFGGGSYDKAVLNDLLEQLPVASVWITNSHGMIPTSALRRFGHVLVFPHPSIDTRVRMLSARLLPLIGSGGDNDGSAAALNSTWTRDLAARYDITPAAIDRAAKIIASDPAVVDLQPAAIRCRIDAYIEQISTSVLARDVRRLPTVGASFDPRFCCTTEALERVERQALTRQRAGSGLRLLFDGPPGGGKTQYALWLAKRLGRDVLLKRPSDLLSKYVGESEQQIAAAFGAAAQAGAVLIIDEADALLYDRSIATHSWEHSQIAEFLQQIQDYKGILIACTNRVEAVDPALRRRFHKHVTFGPLVQTVLAAALAHIFPGVEFAPADMEPLRQGPPLMMSDLATAAEMLEIATDGAPADAADPVGDQIAEPGVPARDVVKEILANARARDRTREIGF